MSKSPAIYILASQRNGTLYIGVTSDLIQRIWEHKQNQMEGFTKKNAVHMLVYYEYHDDMDTAILREKQLKNGIVHGNYGLLKKRILNGMICTEN